MGVGSASRRTGRSSGPCGPQRVLKAGSCVSPRQRSRRHYAARRPRRSAVRGRSVGHHYWVPSRRRDEPGSDRAECFIPAGVSLTDAVRQALEGFHACTAFEPSNGEVDTIEPVFVGTGDPPDFVGEPGVLLTWHQSQARFGLVIGISRLAWQSAGLEAAPFYLRLAVDEPHAPSPDGSRRWFLDLPSGPY